LISDANKKERSRVRLRPCPPRVWKAEASKLREEKGKGIERLDIRGSWRGSWRSWQRIPGASHLHPDPKHASGITQLSALQSEMWTESYWPKVNSCWKGFMADQIESNRRSLLLPSVNGTPLQSAAAGGGRR